MSELPPVPVEATQAGWKALVHAQLGGVALAQGYALALDAFMDVLRRAWTEGRVVVELPAPASLLSSYWKTSGRAVTAHVDASSRPYVKVEGQIWLVGEARAFSLDLLAAVEAAEHGAAAQHAAEKHAAEKHAAEKQQDAEKQDAGEVSS